MISCKSKNNLEPGNIGEKYSGKVINSISKSDTTEIFVGPKSYSFLKYDKPIKFKVIGFEPALQVAYGNIQGLPTATFIGETYDKELPDTITVLAIYELREFKFGETLIALPDKKNDTTDVMLVNIIVGNLKPKHRFIPGTKYKAFLGNLNKE